MHSRFRYGQDIHRVCTNAATRHVAAARRLQTRGREPRTHRDARLTQAAESATSFCGTQGRRQCLLRRGRQVFLLRRLLRRWTPGADRGATLNHECHTPVVDELLPSAEELVQIK